jgi:DNA-binding FadR family transcriptional regulator
MYNGFNGKLGFNMVKKRSQKSLSQRVADEIYDMIVMEKFRPGDKLPNENDLSVDYGVSRATLREAIRWLSAQGVLEVQRGKGTFISTDMKLCHDFGFRNLERIRIRMKDLFEMRLLFEPQVAALACQRATAEEMQNIFEQGQYVEELIRTNKNRIEADQELHRAIVMASHNDFMIRLIPIINRAVSETIILTNNADTLAKKTLHDYTMLMEFFMARDAQGAKNAMAILIRHAMLALGLETEEEQAH